jgi:hypothetical protein
VNELGEVVLTQQQEAEFELELQQVLEVAQAGKKGVLPLELAHLAELLPEMESSDGTHGSSSEEEDQPQAPVWKVISTPQAVPKVCVCACRLQAPSALTWCAQLLRLQSSHLCRPLSAVFYTSVRGSACQWAWQCS